jgi:hypothetical protein
LTYLIVISIYVATILKNIVISSMFVMGFPRVWNQKLLYPGHHCNIFCFGFAMDLTFIEDCWMMFSHQGCDLSVLWVLQDIVAMKNSLVGNGGVIKPQMSSSKHCHIALLSMYNIMKHNVFRFSHNIKPWFYQ